jgi:hypothetical protein
MSFIPYKVSDCLVCWRGPEPAIRDLNNNGTKDETNAATGTFWTFPVFVGSANQFVVRKRKKFGKHYGSGSRYHAKITDEGYNELAITVSGSVVHRSLLYYLADACTTTDNAPGAGYYLHTYTNAATHANPPKTFEILQKLHNDKTGGAEVVYNLYIGCIVKAYTETGAQNGIVTGTWTIVASNMIAGTALTTPGWPTYPNVRNFMTADGVLTWNKGGVAMNCLTKEYSVEFTTDKRLILGNNYYAVNVQSPNEVVLKLRLKVIAYETDSYDDSNDDPIATAQNKDVTWKISRDTTYDFFSINIENAFQTMPEESWEDGILVETHEFELNPHEASSLITITEENNLDDDRYET